jgi:hypothetical protein
VILLADLAKKELRDELVEAVAYSSRGCIIHSIVVHTLHAGQSLRWYNTSFPLRHAPCAGLRSGLEVQASIFSSRPTILGHYISVTFAI